VAQGVREMNEQLQPPELGSIEDAKAEAAISKARLAERAAKFGFTPGQQAVFDAGFERLRDDVSRRKKILALPSLKQRATDLDTLRRDVEKIKKDGAAFLDGPPGFLSNETHAWLSEADAVAVELATLVKPSRYEILNRGHERPNEYRRWLIGLEIPALFAKVYGGAKLPVTTKGTKPKGKRGMEFVRGVLRELGENDAKNETIKNLIFKAKNEVRTSKTPT
jgi:hypothetical protein